MSDHFRKKYEEQFAEFAGAKGARAFMLGRHAIAILLKALDIQPGDKVGVCSFTCLAVIEAVKVCGAIPVYLDIDEHICVDPNEIIIQKPGSLKAIILQHTFGNPGRFDELLAACKKIGAKIIEDCAHSPEGFWNNKRLGTFGDCAVGQAGLLTVNSLELLEKVDEQIKLYASAYYKESNPIWSWFKNAYQPLHQTRLDCFLGYNYSRLRSFLYNGNQSFLKNAFPPLSGYIVPANESKAKEGLHKLQNWPLLRQIRLDNMAMIERYFTDNGLTLWPRRPEAKIIKYRYPLRVFNKWQKVHRAGMLGLDLAGWYSSPVHPLNETDLAKVNYHHGMCPRSEGTIERLVHLPTDASLNKNKLEAIMRILH